MIKDNRSEIINVLRESNVCWAEEYHTLASKYLDSQIFLVATTLFSLFSLGCWINHYFIG
jgi:hypothetical protein